MTLELKDIELEEEEDLLATLEHDVIAGNIFNALKNFLKDKNLGQACGGSVEYRFIAESPQESLRMGKQPDVSFITKEKLPQRLRVYPEIVPDFAVEVSSPSDKEYIIEAKVAFYRQHGVKLIWIAHPYSQSIDVYHFGSGAKRVNFVVGEELSGEEVIPGFKLKVSDIFDYPPDSNPIPDPKPGRKRKPEEV
jgi:Uma2 family endonuclease